MSAPARGGPAPGVGGAGRAPSLARGRASRPRLAPAPRRAERRTTRPRPRPPLPRPRPRGARSSSPVPGRGGGPPLAPVGAAALGRRRSDWPTADGVAGCEANRGKRSMNGFARVGRQEAAIPAEGAVRQLRAESATTPHARTQPASGRSGRRTGRAASGSRRLLLLRGRLLGRVWPAPLSRFRGGGRRLLPSRSSSASPAAGKLGRALQQRRRRAGWAVRARRGRARPEPRRE